MNLIVQDLLFLLILRPQMGANCPQQCELVDTFLAQLKGFAGVTSGM